MAFFTDADLPAARIAHLGVRLAEHAADTDEVGAILAESEFTPKQGGFTAAHSSTLDRCIGDGWIAAGDASMTFDPLSSQGLMHALFSGLAAAEAVEMSEMPVRRVPVAFRATACRFRRSRPLIPR